MNLKNISTDKPVISPSLLAADFANLETEIKKAEIRRCRTAAS